MFSIAMGVNFFAAFFNLVILDLDASPFPTLTLVLVFVNLAIAMFMAFKAMDTGEW